MINRKEVNTPQVSAQDFPKSGFDLSYNTRQDFVLGLLHPSGYQHIMPADKFRMSHQLKYTFNTLSVPEISDVEISQHDFIVPLRAIDTTFIKAMVPTELNGMSAAWRTPQFTLRNLVDIIVGYEPTAQSSNIIEFFGDWLDSNQFNKGNLRTLVSGIVSSFGDKFYNADFVSDYMDRFQSLLNTLSNTSWIDDNIYIVLDAIFTPLMGEGSLLDYLGYNIIRRQDLYKIADSMVSDGENDFTGYVTNIPQCEYALRAYYAIWYEYYRDKYLEKRSNDLPDWRDFGSTSILGDMSGIICFLPTRIRSWAKDMFVGSMPDDISRHVYAPIFSEIPTNLPASSHDYQYLNAEDNNPAVSGFAGVGSANIQSYNLSYLDSNGVSRQIVCPLPKAVNDALNTLSSGTMQFETIGLDLRDLRKSQMLERYLKRNFYFGDEYEDRMLAQYGSRISDNSIRRPTLIGSSLSTLNPSQQVANMTNEQTKAGTRIATAQDSAATQMVTWFAEEFAIVISIVSVMPRAQYNGICPQNMLGQVTDFPLPVFANNNDEFGRVIEIAQAGYQDPQWNSAGNGMQFQFGHYPYAHAWRSRVDEVHGSFLSDRSDYTFRRFFGLDSADSTPTLNYKFIHCRPNLGMFFDQIRLDGQGYMTINHKFFVERVLPTPVEEI